MTLGQLSFDKMMYQQKWHRHGLIFEPKNNGCRYAAVPMLDTLTGARKRIYFSDRDTQNCSFVRYIEVDDQMRQISGVSEPVLEPGDLGEFDENGVMGTCIVATESDVLLFYIGWNLGVSVPFRNALGVAKWDAIQNRFVKLFKGPLLDRSPWDPCFIGSCEVMKTEAGYLMYYLSCVKWNMVNGCPRHKYHLKIAHSDDAIHWRREGQVAIDFKHKDEYALSVPRIMSLEQGFGLWFSHRGAPQTPNYRIGFAYSGNAFDWQRFDDAVTLTGNVEPWESVMQCYPFVFNDGEHLCMLYNGDGYGNTGIGMATLENS